MTLSITQYRAAYAGNGGTTDFPVPFRFEANAELKLRLFDAAGNADLLTEVTHYSAEGAGEASGGNIAMLTAPASGETLLIERVGNDAQNLDLTAGGALNAESLETALDRQMLAVQENRGEVARALKIHPLDPDTELVLPLAADRAWRALSFDAGGLCIAGPTSGEITSAQTYAEAAGTAKDAAVVAQGLAEAAQSAAETAETNAETAETGSVTAQGLAEDARDAAIAASEHMAYSYAFDTGTADADPGSARLRFDNATLGSATEMYISETSGEGDLSALMAIWDDSTSAIKATVRIRNPLAPTNWFEFYVTGAITDAGSYRKVPIQPIATNGSLTNDTDILLQVIRNGDLGTGAVDSFNGRTGAVSPAEPDYESFYPLIGNVRERLTAARTYYVATTGSDSNDGLTSGAPFLTVQKAMDVIAGTLDLRGYSVTVQLADGAYTGGLTLKPYITAGGSVTFQGNSSSITAVTISKTGNALTNAARAANSFTVKDMKLSGTVNDLYIQGAGMLLNISGITFVGGNSQLAICTKGAEMILTGTNYVDGGSGAAFWAQQGSQIFMAGSTLVYNNALTFSTVHFYSSQGSVLTAYGMTFTNPGNVTGPRYVADGVASIFTNGGGASYFPGTAVGAVYNGGVYY